MSATLILGVVTVFSGSDATTFASETDGVALTIRPGEPISSCGDSKAPFTPTALSVEIVGGWTAGSLRRRSPDPAVLSNETPVVDSSERDSR